MYDLIIIGGSAASSAAAIYAARRKLNCILITEEFGGEVATSGEVENYPGFIHTNGFELAEAFRKHVEANGMKPELGVRVELIEKMSNGLFKIYAKKGGVAVDYVAKAVIVATGVHPRHLGVPGEEELKGKGVTWCTTCDGPLYKNKKVVTIGGGNSALDSALMLAQIATHVTIINKNDTFKGEAVLLEKVQALPNVDIVYQAKTARIEGSAVVERVVYVDAASGEERTVDAQGVFIHIGLVPNSGIVPPEVQKNAAGEIEINLQCETSVPGLFAAGDVTNIPYKQIAIATGQGVCAALSSVDYINKFITPAA
ncbi:MAG TPA: FAD-dependent oxidoreductase [Patescibacteria group bacterium]|nr:FAD-dependent oxidoreductase [Patescibacteria group bacterium]